jgi:hypothetical protein
VILINAMTAMLVAINKNILVMVLSRMDVGLGSYLAAFAGIFNSTDR